MKYKILLALVLSLVGFSFAGIFNTGIVRALPSADVIEEYMNTTRDGSQIIYKSRSCAQYFTPTYAHTISSAVVCLYQNGTPVDVRVSIRETSSGSPKTTMLSYATIDGDIITDYITGDLGSTYVATFNTEITVEAGITYALVVEAPTGAAGNFINWVYDSDYGSASAGSCITGNSWTSLPGSFIFRISGISCLSMEYISVFQGYAVANDWLFTFMVYNVAPPDFNENDPSSSYEVSLLDDTNTVIAKNNLVDWGYKPQSIYISANTAGAFTWGMSNLTLCMSKVGTSTTNITVNSSTFDWAGQGLFKLDAWVRLTAGFMTDYYGVNMLESLNVSGDIYKDVLTTTGARYFTAGIPGLASLRPGLFSSTALDYYQSDEAHNELIIPGGSNPLGSDIASRLSDVATMLGMNSQWAGIGLILTIYLAAAFVVYVSSRDATAAVAIPLPIIIAGGYFGIISIALLAILTLVAVACLLYLIWLRTA